MTNSPIHIASDHRGFEFKSHLIQNCKANWVDHGPTDGDRVDYPTYAQKVASQVNGNPNEIGILICGSGQGMAMAANKYPNVRAALCWNEDSCRLSREHNNANILCLGADLLEHNLAFKLVEIFLQTDFEGGRHLNRVNMISQNLPSHIGEQNA